MTAVPLRQVPGERILVREPHAPDPLPLYPPEEAAAPFPVGALGPVLGSAAMAIARKVQVPDALAAQSVLAAASLAAQAHADVDMPFGQSRPLSLYFATVAGSGDRKSTADNEALWPIRRYEKHLKEDHDRLLENWVIENAVWTAERKKIDGSRKLDATGRRAELTRLGPAPLPPLYPMLTAPDPTIEGLAKAWINAPAALGVFTAEGGLFVGGHGMSNDHRLKTAAAFSHLWDGLPFRRVRAADGVIILDGRRFSMHVMIQPEAAALFLSDPVLRDQGLLSRVLVAAPVSVVGTRAYRAPLPEDEQAIQTYGARILSILERGWPLAQGKRNELMPRRLVIGPDAVDVWTQFHNHVEEQCGAGSDLHSIRDFGSKASEHAARLSGVLTIAEDPNASTISVTAMERGTTLADWYVAEALRLQQRSRSDARLVRAQSLYDWIIRHLDERNETSITFREILQNAPATFRTKAPADEAIRTLLDHQRVADLPGPPRTITPVRASR